jgi:tetratricopeptide (TPR) repeat protein
MKLKRPQLISQGSLSRMLQAAGTAWSRREFQKGIEIMERVSRLDSANSAVLLDLGRLYGLRYDYVAAERCFEKAIRITPKRTKALATAALHCREFSNFPMSERYYLRALEQNDATPKLFVELAELYERLRRLEDASNLIDRALRLNDACPEALLVRARLERQVGHLEEAERLIHSFAAKPNLDTWVHVRAWYELGAILDRKEKYDDAFVAFMKAKGLLHPHMRRSIIELQVVRKRIKEIQVNISSDMLQRWFDCAPALPPPRRLALLGGHPRSGTTLLEQVLDSHQDIISLEETEIFHDDAYAPLQINSPDETPILSILESAQISALQQSRSNYFHSGKLSLGQTIGDRLLIDKNPSLTFLIPAFIRIFPEVKLLITLRDPRDVVLSCFMQPIHIGQGSAAYLSLESTIEEYAAMMSLWQTLSPMIKDHYLEVRYEDMVEDLESVARRTLDFLGAQWDARVLGFDEHARQKIVRSPTYADVTKPVYKRAIGRWRNYQKYLEPHLSKLESFARAFGYEV